LLDQFLLAPDLQVAGLSLESVAGVEPMSKLLLRALADAGTWADHRAAPNLLLYSGSLGSLART
jgi:hypothetical protein